LTKQHITMRKSDPQKAVAWAIAAHDGQMYDLGVPYVLHLRDVVNILREYNTAPDYLLCAGWLHDMVEDTPITIEEVRDSFGFRIADIVDRVTDPKNMSRKERHLISYPRIAELHDAVIIKLADRLANVRCVKKNEMYRKEHPLFRGWLWKPEKYTGGTIQLMWDELDERLGFKA